MQNALKMMESKMTPEAINRSKIMAEQEILAVRLNNLREELGINNAVTKATITRLKKSNDIRLSTLIDYLNSLGMGLEIKAFPKNKTPKINSQILLKI